jgi:hypothetical protein
MLKKALNFTSDYSFAMISVGAFIVLYAYEITLSTVLFYFFASIGFILTTGFIMVGIAGVLSKPTLDENEKLKIKVEKLQIKLSETLAALDTHILRTEEQKVIFQEELSKRLFKSVPTEQTEQTEPIEPVVQE